MNLFGIMQALVSFVQDDRDNLRTIISGKHKFVFVCRGPLVLVSVSQTPQSETQVRAFDPGDPLDWNWSAGYMYNRIT